MISALTAKLIGGAVILALAAGAWLYVTNLQKEVAIEKANRVVAEEALKSTKNTVDNLRTDITAMKTSFDKLTKETQEARQDVKNLEKRFTETKAGEKRDLENLAAKHPLLIEKAINNGSKEAMRCNELVTGAAPNPGEKNSLCPKLVQQ